MANVEVNTGTYISRYAFWNPATWSIPALYWNTMSQEQRYHAICREIAKIIQYSDYLGVNVDDIAGRLKAIETGQLDEYIKDEIEAWFEDNEPAIVSAIQTLNDVIPVSDFDSVNTVKAAIDAEDAKIDALADIIPDSDFSSVSTVKDAIDAEDAKIDALADIIPDSSFSSVSTVKDAIDAEDAKIDALADIIPDSEFTNVNTVKNYIDAADTTLQNNINTLSNQVNNIRDLNAHVILIGDSYVHMNNTAPTIGKSITNIMSNWDVYNIADGGSGFTFGGEDNRTFKQQFDYAKLNYNNFADTDAVIIIGGRNEAGGLYSPNYPSGSLEQAVDDLLDDVTTSLPNAKVYVFPGLFDWIMPNANLKAVINTVESVSRKYGVFCARGCWSWGTGEESTLYVGGSDIHPNSTGCNQFAKYILQAIFDNNEYTYINRTALIGSLNTNYHINAYTQEDNICLQGGWQQNNAGSGSNLICAPSGLPDWFTWLNRAGQKYNVIVGYGECEKSATGVAGNNGLQAIIVGQYGLACGQGVETRSNAVMPDGFEIRIQSCQSVFALN